MYPHNKRYNLSVLLPIAVLSSFAKDVSATLPWRKINKVKVSLRAQCFKPQSPDLLG